MSSLTVTVKSYRRSRRMPNADKEAVAANSIKGLRKSPQAPKPKPGAAPQFKLFPD